MAKPINLLTLTITIAITLTTISIIIPTSLSLTTPQSIYAALESHGLPIGLLPSGITNFTINPSTNQFEVRLARSCHAKFETDVRYDFNVSGTLSYGKIDDLSGIAAQELFLWFPVKGIRVDVPSSGLIYFDVGVVFKQFSLSLFETPRQCDEAVDSRAELVVFDGRARINQAGKNEDELSRGDVLKAVS
ncbi:hypothetical protein RJ640_000289 [Escallonia rubra]|uniref:Uncharacterized protein n=1 Tax=Escallonia rubra TaxID=112253 RepID=A0AA88US13_9ASTE|nr:hypothetical protein RJ640_000289 [Escallonia rubra]